MDKISLFHGQKFAISEYSRHVEYDFLKEDHKKNFHSKNQEGSQRHLEVIGQKISNCQFWPKNGQILVLNRQNFALSEYSQHIEYDFLKENHKNNFYTKNQEDSQRRLEYIGKKLSNLSFWPKNGQILATNGQILAISEFSRHILYVFLKEDHKGSFHTKNYENLQWSLEDMGKKVHFLAKNDFWYKIPPKGLNSFF